MANAVTNMLRLGRAGLVLAQHGVRFVPTGMPVPLPLRIARAATAPIGWLSAPFRRREPKHARVVGGVDAAWPQLHQARPVPRHPRRHHRPRTRRRPAAICRTACRRSRMAEARAAIEQALGGKLEDHFVEFGPPVAAASIAQVHKAVRHGQRRTQKRSPSRSCAPMSRSASGATSTATTSPRA